MRSIFGVLVLFAFAGGSAGAQTINGESTYEDNYYHVPPDGGTKSPVTVVRPDPAPQAADDARLRGKLYPNGRGSARGSE